MKRYFIKQGDFSNVYELVYITDQAEEEAIKAEGYERITREEAIKKAKAERERMEFEPMNAGYADSHIWPFSKVRKDYARRENFIASHTYDREYIIEG